MPRHNSPPAPLPTHATKEDAAAARKNIAALEKISRIVTTSLMAIGGSALIFTATNVTFFAINHHVTPWVAWMLDPMVSVALVTVLYVDGVLTEQGADRPSGWPFVLRWFAGLSTWLMNCWQSLWPSQFTFPPSHADIAGVVLHSVAPGLVIALSEASTGYRVHVAARLQRFRAILHIADETARAEREAADRRAREELEREAEAQRRREEQEYQLRLEQERREAALAEQRQQREHEEKLARERREADLELKNRERLGEIEAAREKARLERERAAAEAEEREREAARRAQVRRAEAEAKAIEERAKAEAREREAAARARRKASQRTVNSGSSTLTVNPASSTVNSSTVNPAGVTGNTEPTVNPGRESYRQPDNTATVRTGNVPDETWVEVGHPVYEAVRDAVGKRPPEGAFRSALAERVAELVRAGKLPEVALNPSLSTAKRVRGLIERRFPDVSPIHPVADEEAC